MIELCTGNLLAADAEALVNTVNIKGVMGKGIALQFKKAFPEMEAAYKKACKTGELAPGKVHLYERADLFAHPKYIINFPTKRDWRHPSRLSDIQSGLEDLARVIKGHHIKSIAVPPLGCGLGGLNWSEVLPMIKKTFQNIEGVRVLVFEPNGAPSPEKQINRTKKPELNPNRAALLGLLNRYRMLDYPLSMIEIQKLAYFLQEMGQPLRLEFKKEAFGPYADDLRKVLRHLEGHYIIGFGEGRNKPNTPITLIESELKKVEETLKQNQETFERFEKVAQLVEGFESPYGLELLSTVHWVATQDSPPAKTPEEALKYIQSWSPRKAELMQPEHVKDAWEKLSFTKALSNNTKCELLYPMKNKFDIQEYVICFLDLMGQKNELKKWEFLPKEQPCGTFDEGLENTVGRIIKVRKQFLEDTKRDFLGNCLDDQIPHEDLELHNRLKELTPKVQQFSDTLVMYSPISLDANQDLKSLYPLWYFIYSCTQQLPFFLSEATPIRGSIHIGTGTELDNNDFYGPALEKAYILESQIAQYPRVVISNRVIELIEHLNNDSPSSRKIINLSNQSLYKIINKMLYKDDYDKHNIYTKEPIFTLDYLSPDALKYTHRDDISNQAYLFICKERDRFKNDNKLGPRYQKLVEYFESRRSNWDSK